MSRRSPEELLRRLDRPNLRICDVRWYLVDPARGRREYAKGHLPGAVFVDVDSDLVATEGPGRHPLPDPVSFARRLQALGIGDDSEVVAYDDAGGAVAARLWWMLEDLGHHDVSVLDGGVTAWLAAGGGLTTEIPAYPPGRLTLRDHWTRTIDRAALIPRLVAGDVALVDARAPERYRGDIEPVDPVAGHVPGAVNRPFAGNLGPDGRLLPADELRRRFADLGQEVVVSCGSGINACHDALAMRVAGLPDPLLYPGSYSDWSRAGMGVATGDEPGRYEPASGSG
jgi:thiosulfate/3-mercaptopyruvate sulfurtransferase